MTQAVPVKDAPRIDPRAGQLPSAGQLVDTAKLIDAYYTRCPDPAVPAQRVAFGTSGHRGSSFDRSFNECARARDQPGDLPVSPQGKGIDGPLFLGIDTHALSRPAFESALEVLAANGVDVDDRARATNTRRRRRFRTRSWYTTAGAQRGLADGIVITPSHNPPEDGGFKYNPPNGGPADTDVTGWIEDQRQRAARRRPEGCEANSVRAGAARRDDARARFSRRLRQRSRQRDRHRRDSRRRHPHGRRSARRRRRALLGARSPSATGSISPSSARRSIRPSAS